MSITLSSALSVDDAVAAYHAASVGEKSRMRTAVTDAAMAAVMSGDMELAAHYGTIRNALSAAKPATPSVDYAAVASDMAATYEAAAKSLRDGIDFGDTIVRATMPGTADDATVAKLTTIRTRAARSANGTVAAFIAAHVTDTPRTIAELLNAAGVDAAYRPSSGAIGACLVRVANGTEEVDGFAVADIDGRRGAVAI
jgi:hypothetical protein